MICFILDRYRLNLEAFTACKISVGGPCNGNGRLIIMQSLSLALETGQLDFGKVWLVSVYRATTILQQLICS